MRFGKKLIGAVLGLGLLATPAFTFAADRHDDRGRQTIHEDFHVREFRGDRERDRDRDHDDFDRGRVEVVVPAHVGLYAPDCR